MEFLVLLQIMSKLDYLSRKEKPRRKLKKLLRFKVSQIVIKKLKIMI
jgi:hypothetical protein